MTLAARRALAGRRRRRAHRSSSATATSGASAGAPRAAADAVEAGQLRSRGRRVRAQARRRLRGRRGVRALGDPRADRARAAGADLGPARDARLDRSRGCCRSRTDSAMETGMTSTPRAPGCALEEVELDLEHRATGRNARRLPAPRPPAADFLRVYVSRRLGSGRFAPMILAIDQGTTGTTCLVFDEQARLRRPRLPRVHAALPAARAGWSTTPREIWEVTRAVAARGARRRPARRPAISARRDHQPARDRRGLGRAHRRAAAPRDRVAGPPHGRALRRAARAGARGRSCASAPAS